jgi:AraC-like DNA-binding protein
MFRDNSPDATFMDSRTQHLPRPILRRRASLRDGRVRVGPLMAIPDLLREHGVDAQALFEACRVPIELFSDPEATISFVEGDALLARAATLTGCAHFGLLVGQRAPAQSLGALGYLMLSAATVAEALDALTAHLNVHDRGAIVSVHRDGPLARLRYALVVPGLARTDQIYSLSLAVGQGIMRTLCGPAWRVQAVTFSFARPAHVAPYVECFGVMPQFDAPDSALVFAADALERPLPGADPFLNRVMRDHVGAQAQSAGGDLVEEVRRFIRGATAPGMATLDVVARFMHVHERTLKRQLAARGTTFRAVRDGLLAETARDLLSNTAIDIVEIAAALGYSDAAAFTRAFRRWEGTTPNAWRAANRPRSGND